ncbi:MAG: hypothetical protein QM426_04045 [Euryarchaeota archaeon]|nr:hypothetical protein [Euryarchaeota archaeon]
MTWVKRPSAKTSIIVSATTAQKPFAASAEVKVTDKDGKPVRNANLILKGLGSASLNRTEINGVTVLTRGKGASGEIEGPTRVTEEAVASFAETTS